MPAHHKKKRLSLVFYAWWLCCLLLVGLILYSVAYFTGGATIYAIIRSGGRQYKVSAGMEILVEKLDAEENKAVELQYVLLINTDDKLIVGNPSIAGASVMATSKGLEKGEKLRISKYKNKTRQQTITGHRQTYTRLLIDSISVPSV